MDNVNLPLGLRVQTQIPLDVKTYSPNEATLSNLGVSDNLAFTYVQGLIVYCVEEKTRWEWREAIGAEVGLRPTNFVYPNNVVVFGIDYSNKPFNFFSVGEAIVDISPFQNKDEGNGIGIIIRDRDPLNYGNIGFRAFDTSFSDEADSTYGATAFLSFAQGYQTVASGDTSTAVGSQTTSSGYASFASGSVTSAIGDYSHTEGVNASAMGPTCHSEGWDTTSQGIAAHSEGFGTQANANYSHAQGNITIANGIGSHAEGNNTIANGNYSHAEGNSNVTNGLYSHSGGANNFANSFAESSIGCNGTNLSGTSGSFVSSDRIFNVGIGPNTSTRLDGLSVFKNGVVTLPTITNALIAAASPKALVTKEFLVASIPIIQNNPQKVITADYTLTDADDNYVIIINNVTPITITLNTTITVANFNVGFIQKGDTANTVTFAFTGVSLHTPVGYKLRGQYYQAFIERELNTVDFYLLGNTKL